MECHKMMQELIWSSDPKQFQTSRAEEFRDTIDWTSTFDQFLFHANEDPPKRGDFLVLVQGAIRSNFK